MRVGIIYRAAFPSGKVYIGQTIQGLTERMGHHCRSSLNINSSMYNTVICKAIRKYGKDKIIWDVLYKDVPRDKLDYMEIKAISDFDSFKNGYNSTIGGRSGSSGMTGFKHSEETKKKISEANKGRLVSKKTGAKISEANKGRLVSEKTRTKISKANKNRWTKDLRFKKSEASSGENGSGSKLTSTQVKEIRTKYIPRKYSICRLAKEYGVCNTTIYNIVNNKSWIK